ncbi:MAG: hypothetical protein GJ680_07510 [Alteromonadaceae bacterium]|nr:hypothetical protein [Alteromonadaceae bacterium]
MFTSTQANNQDHLIPVNGGYSDVNGLPIQTHLCIVFDRVSCTILSIHGTHNAAEEESQHFYRKGIDAVSGELRFFSETLRPADVVGMQLQQFAHCHENYKLPKLEPRG